MGFCVANTVKFCGQRVGFAIDGDGPLLHGLQQRRLRLGGRAIDFVGQQKGGEHRPAHQREFVALEVEDVGAGDVGGHQVRRELDARELAAEHVRQRARQQRLGDARHAFDQRVLARQDHDQRRVDHLILAQNHFAHFGARGGEGLVEFI